MHRFDVIAEIPQELRKTVFDLPSFTCTQLDIRELFANTPAYMNFIMKHRTFKITGPNANLIMAVMMRHSFPFKKAASSEFFWYVHAPTALKTCRNPYDPLETEDALGDIKMVAFADIDLVEDRDMLNLSQILSRRWLSSQPRITLLSYTDVTTFLRLHEVVSERLVGRGLTIKG